MFRGPLKSIYEEYKMLDTKDKEILLDNLIGQYKYMLELLKNESIKKEAFKGGENKMNIELWKKDGSWVECSWNTFEEFKQFIEDYEDIYIIDSWIVDNYSYILVHWMDENTAKYRESLSPDTSAIHEALESCKLNYTKLAEAIVEALKKE